MDPVHLGVLSGTEVGLVISSAMWGITTVQTAAYYMRFKSDSMYLKVAVAVNWLLASIFLLTMTIGINQYIYLTNSGNYTKLWPPAMSAASLCALFTTYFVQALYVRRIYRMWGKLPIPLLCAIGTLYSFSIGFYFNTVVETITLERFTQLENRTNWLVTSMYSVTAAEDIVITATLCFLLRRNRDNLIPQTLRIVQKLVTWTVETGMITSLVALGVAATASSRSITTRYPGVWLALCMVDTTIYPLTFIFMLNGRTLLRSIEDESTGITDLKTINLTLKTCQSTDAVTERSITFGTLTEDRDDLDGDGFHPDKTVTSQV